MLLPSIWWLPVILGVPWLVSVSPISASVVTCLLVSVTDSPSPFPNENTSHWI